MEVLTPYQLQQYENILQEINSEFEKSKHLKREIQRADDTIIALNLCLSAPHHKISHVNVKIFSSIVELVNLFDCDINNFCDVQALSKCSDCNFFLIEVILPKSLLVKLTELKWKLRISVRSGTSCKCKVVLLTDNTSIFQVIPVVSGPYEYTVQTSLFCCIEEEWFVIDLHSVKIDISYFFKTYKEKTTTTEDNLLNLTKLYNKDVDLGCTDSSQLQNQLKWRFDEHNLVATLVRNSYHRLNLESFTAFVKKDIRVVDVHLSICDKKVTVLYNKDRKTLKIRSGPLEMKFLIKFFLEHCTYNYEDLKKKLKVVSRKKDSIEEMDLTEILSLYQDMRQLWR